MHSSPHRFVLQARGRLSLPRGLLHYAVRLNLGARRPNDSAVAICSSSCGTWRHPVGGARQPCALRCLHTSKLRSEVRLCRRRTSLRIRYRCCLVLLGGGTCTSMLRLSRRVVSREHLAAQRSDHCSYHWPRHTVRAG